VNVYVICLVKDWLMLWWLVKIDPRRTLSRLVGRKRIIFVIWLLIKQLIYVCFVTLGVIDRLLSCLNSCSILYNARKVIKLYIISLWMTDRRSLKICMFNYNSERVSWISFQVDIEHVQTHQEKAVYLILIFSFLSV
jgi:hypothetical protein